MGDAKKVCSVEKAGTLDNNLRRLVQNPAKILKAYLKEGMMVLDFGCGPGFFTLDMARLVGQSGKVIASDLQAEMLEIVKNKIQGTGFQQYVHLHRCEANKVGVDCKVDFVLAFYVVHEMPDQGAFFAEIAAILKENGQILIVEPPFHVSKAEFAESIEKAKEAKLFPVERPKIFLSKAVLLKKI